MATKSIVRYAWKKNWTERNIYLSQGPKGISKYLWRNRFQVQVLVSSNL